MSISMYARNPPLKQDSPVGGAITLHPNPGTRFDVETFTITLLGVSTTRTMSKQGLNGVINERSETFLEVKQQLLPERMSLGSGFVAGFMFYIPEDPDSARLTPFDDSYLDLFGKPKPQTLPPSGDFGPGNVIRYSLEAFLIDETSQSEIRASEPLHYFKTRAVELPDPQMVTVLQSKKNADQKYNHGTAAFQLALNAPQTLTQGGSFPLILHLSSQPDDGSAQVSEVSLRSCLVQFLARTDSQCGIGIEKNTIEEHSVASFEPLPCGSSDVYSRRIVQDETMDLAALLPGLAVPLEHSPSFETPNIQRSYRLRVSLVVECQGVTHDIMFEMDQTNVLAAEYSISDWAAAQRPGYVPPKEWWHY